MHTVSRHLAFHGAIVLLFGVLLGAPYARAIKRNAPEHIVHSWRVAHLSLPMGAILVLAVAALLPVLAVPPGLAWFIALTLIVSLYAFAVSTPLAAMTGQRGLAQGGTGLGRLVYAGNLAGAAFSVLAAAGLVCATFRAL